MSEASEKARAYFLSGDNCAQAVFCAYADTVGVDERTAHQLSAGFGGGIGRLRDTCGALSGLVLLAGFATGDDGENPDVRAQTYALVQRLAARFEDACGSRVCATLLGLSNDGHYPPAPDARTEEYYRTRPCLRFVEAACRVWEEERESR